MAKIELKKGGKKVNGKFVPSTPVTAATPAPAISDGATNRGGSARGDDFAAGFGSEGLGIVTDTGGSINDAIDIGAGRKTRGSVKQDVQNQERIRKAAVTKAKKDKKRREKLANAGESFADANRASTLNTAEGESITAEGEGSSRAQQISDVSARAEELKRQVAEFAEREKNAASNLTSSDTPIVNAENNALDTLTDSKYRRPTDEALTLLDQELKRVEDNLRADKTAIKSTYTGDTEALAGKQASEAGQTSVGLANAGGYLGFSGGAQGVMLSLAKSHRAELQTLKATRDKAIAESENAARNRRWDIVREKAEEVKRIDQETYDREEEYNTRVREQAEIETAKEEKIANQNTIFDSIQAGNKTPEAIFKALKGSIPLEDINSFLEEMSPAGGTGSFKFSGGETAQLLGAGLSSDDIAALHETVNELGYSDEVRNALPASVRAVTDAIFREKTGSSSGKTGVVVNGTELSSVTMQILDGFTSLKELTPTMRAKVKDELYEMGLGDDEAPRWFKDMMMEQYPQGTETPYIGTLWDEFRAGIFDSSGSGTNESDDLDYDGI